MTLLGPIAGGAHGWPFSAAFDDVGAYGYVEEEFFLDGQATPYRWADGAFATRDGRWNITPDQARPFRTRVLVRRPIDMAWFNGVVCVVWTNVTPGFEFMAWESDEALNGAAWVFVSAQNVGLHGMSDDAPGLVDWDRERYGSLHIDSDDLSYDIFTQAARAVGPDRPGNNDQLNLHDPIGGLEVTTLIAVGSSQSASRLATYHNAVQPLSNVFDGYLLLYYFGNGSVLGDDLTMRPAEAGREAIAELSRMRNRGRHLLRDDLQVPVLVFNTECETTAYAPVSQPDSPTFRLWEIAGASHFPDEIRRTVYRKTARDFDAPFIDEVDPDVEVSSLETRPASDAAIWALQQWIKTGEAPQSQPRILTDGDDYVIVRDDLGNAMGGIRLPEFAVPLGRFVGVDDEQSDTNQMGTVRPFDALTLRRLHPSHDAYVKAYERAANQAWRTGVLLPGSRDRMVREARERTIV